MTAERPLTSMPIDELLTALAGRDPVPASGTAAGLTLALAASVAAMSARAAEGRVDDASDTAARLDRLSRRAAELAETDASAYRRVLRATTPDARHDALAQAAEAPVALARDAAETAAEAARLATDGHPAARGDAAVAALLSASAARAGSLLAEIDLAHAGADSGPADAARRDAYAAEAAAGRAIAAATPTPLPPVD